MPHSNPLVLLSLALSLPLEQSAAPAPGPRLEKQWEVSLGPEARRLRAAVCPDGTVHATDGGGRLIGVDPGGKIAFDARFPELGAAWDLACDAERLLVASSESLEVHVLQRRAGQAPAYAASHAVPLPAHALALDKDGGYWILAHTHESRVYKMSARGEVQHKTVVDLPKINPHFTPMAWDESKERLLVVTPSTYEIQSFDRTGKRLETARPDAAAAFKGPGSTPGEVGGDEVRSVVSLPAGRIGVQVSKVSYVRPHVFQNHQVLEVLRSDLRVEKTGISMSRGGRFGRLLGADADGSLYFASTGQDRTMWVVKAKLVE